MLKHLMYLLCALALVSCEDGNKQWIDLEKQNLQFISQHKAVKASKPLDGAVHSQYVICGLRAPIVHPYRHPHAHTHPQTHAHTHTYTHSHPHVCNKVIYDEILGSKHIYRSTDTYTYTETNTTATASNTALCYTHVYDTVPTHPHYELIHHD